MSNKAEPRLFVKNRAFSYCWLRFMIGWKKLVTPSLQKGDYGRLVDVRVWVRCCMCLSNLTIGQLFAL